MFYPAQTSLIPVQIALIRFWENQGGQAIFSHYPYWYLGTAPFRYLSGPILPIFASGLHKFFPNFSLFEVMWLLIGICWVIGTLGLYLLVKEMTRLRPDSLRGYGEARRVAVLAAVFYLFGPIVPFLFRFSNGLYLIAFSFLPFVLLAYLKWIKEESKKRLVIFVFWFTFLLLVDTTIIPALVLGMTAIFLAGVGWKKAEKKIRKSLWLMAGAFFIATFWYTPKYWLTLLGAPSLGGKGVLEVLGWLSKILPTVMALVMAIFSVKWFKKRDFLRDFCFYWLFIFGFLTLVRFLSDPDFWLDWTAYGVELQFGMAMLLGTWFSSVLRARQAQISNLKSQS